VKFKNHRQSNFLASIPRLACDSEVSQHAQYSKFCFAYFLKQDVGQGFEDWDHQKLCKLLNHLRDYGKSPLKHWQRTPIGKGSGHVLEIYGAFPDKAKTEFTLPSSVPNDARWGRFRLDFATRLVGFVVPDALHDTMHATTNHRFDINTFYVVFLDADHKFYIPEKA
jgi:hypothetical protein